MPRWTPGEATIEKLLRDRDLEHVQANVEHASRLRQAAAQHIKSAGTVVSTDPDGAYGLAYDAARKAATSTLAEQGLRPTTAGGHLAVVRSVEAQFDTVPGFSSLDRLRRRRAQVEYPNIGSAEVTSEEATEAIKVAADCLESAIKLTGKLGVF